MPLKPIVTPQSRTMLVYRTGGHSAWLEDRPADLIVAIARKYRTLQNLAYVVRCRPKGAPSCRR